MHKATEMLAYQISERNNSNSDLENWVCTEQQLSLLFDCWTNEYNIYRDHNVNNMKSQKQPFLLAAFFRSS